MTKNNNLPPDLLKRAQNLDAEIASYAGKIPPETQKILIQEMLQLRVDELVLTQHVNIVVAIHQAYKEFADYGENEEKQAKEKGDLQSRPLDFIYLDAAKDHLLKELSEAEKDEHKNKKKEKDEEDEKKIASASENTSSVKSSSVFADGVFVQAMPAAPDTRSGCRVNFGGGGGNGVSACAPVSNPSPTGRQHNETTLYFNGIRVAIYSAGVHREMTMHLPPNATSEQQKAYDAAVAAASNYGKDAYSLLTHNCVGAVATTLQALDPDLQCGNVRMPWSLDSKVNGALQAQLAQQQPAIADGNMTSAQGVSTPKLSPVDREEEEKDQQHQGLSVPTPTPISRS